MIHILAASFWLHDIWHPLHGNGYQFWSGIGGDFSEITILGGLYAIFRHQNCHVKKCWRLGKYPLNNTGLKICKKHHPALNGDPITQETVRNAYFNNTKDKVQ